MYVATFEGDKFYVQIFREKRWKIESEMIHSITELC